MRVLGADDLPGQREVGQAERDVPRFADERDDLVPGFDDGRSRVDADPRIELEPMFASEFFREHCERLEQAEAGPRRAASRVLERDRIAETGQKPLLVTLDDRAVEGEHGLLAGLLERLQDFRLVFGIGDLEVNVGLEHLRGADQHGHLPAFRFAPASRR